ncbi:MAG: rhomboid family intramembrane serine protease [Bacilli bacterium]|nr:rhomboid family intramembrane serine protease [Bacilli bacterium]
MNGEIKLDDKNIIVMKLLHYFITEKNYNPIILQGVEDEIWLENMDEDYKVIRIVSNYIHNNEQFDFDKFKTERIVKKIKRKTLSFNVNVLSIFLDLGENVTTDLLASNNNLCIKIDDETDLLKNGIIKEHFPDISKKLKFNEKGIELFAKITNDINKHNEKDARKVDDVFKPKVPYITIALIVINVLIYFGTTLTGTYDKIVNDFCVYGPAIRDGEYYRIITGMFLHGNILHLFFNCWVLYIIGSQLESFIGKFKYAIIYFIAGISGSLFSMIFSHSASIGASGAIFGLMGALIYFGYHYRVYLGNYVKTQLIPLVVLNLIIGMSPGIDNFAHIGGLIGGTIATMALGIDGKSTTFEKTNGLIITILFLAFSIYMAFVIVH